MSHVAVCQWSWWRGREARSRCQKLVLLLVLALVGLADLSGSRASCSCSSVRRRCESCPS
eukprot:scaffold8112_cov136-Isochrysis_galbana.AAC.1